MKTRLVRLTCMSCLLVLLGGSILSQVRADPVIYSQPSNFPNGLGVGASQNDTTPGGLGNFATVYDNFTLASSSTVTDLHWEGGFFGSTTPPIQSFTIQFWSNNAGQPGNSLLSQTISGNANQTFVGTAESATVFDYSANLTSPFDATGGIQYWLSIVANLPAPQEVVPYPPGIWGWHTGTGGDGVSYQDISTEAYLLGFVPSGRISHDLDSAFALTGSAVAPIPEPATMLLLGSGLIGLAGYGRKKFFKK